MKAEVERAAGIGGEAGESKAEDKSQTGNKDASSAASAGSVSQAPKGWIKAAIRDKDYEVGPGQKHQAFRSEFRLSKERRRRAAAVRQSHAGNVAGKISR